MEQTDSPFITYFDCGGGHGYHFDIRSYIPESMAVVDRARFERVLVVAEAAGKLVGAMWGSLPDGSARRDLEVAVTSLHPGDLAPLPGHG